MAGFLGKAMAGLGQGMAAVGQDALRDRAMMAREQRLLELRGAQEQATYDRNRKDELADRDVAARAAAAKVASDRDWEGSKMLVEESYKSNAAAQKAKDDRALQAQKDAAEKEREQIKADAKEGGGKIGGWKPDELEKEARVLVAKGMGLDSNNIMNFDKNLQKEFYDAVERTVSEVRRDPSLSVGAAANRVVQGQDKPGTSSGDYAADLLGRATGGKTATPSTATSPQKEDKGFLSQYAGKAPEPPRGTLIDPVAAKKEADLRQRTQQELRDQSMKMGKDFGIKPEATDAQRGDVYTAGAKAYTKLEPIVRSGRIDPSTVSREEVDLALRFASMKKDQSMVNKLTDILNRFY